MQGYVIFLSLLFAMVGLMFYAIYMATGGAEPVPYSVSILYNDGTHKTYITCATSKREVVEKACRGTERVVSISVERVKI